MNKLIAGLSARFIGASGALYGFKLLMSFISLL